MALGAAAAAAVYGKRVFDRGWCWSRGGLVRIRRSERPGVFWFEVACAWTLAAVLVAVTVFVLARLGLR